MTDKEYKEKEEALFNSANIPQELRPAMSYLAYEQGHSYGWSDVYSILQDIVYGLKEPIQKLIERIREEKN